MRMNAIEPLEQYLQASEFIDYLDPQVNELAQALSYKEGDKIVVAKRCFEYVRDEIKHTSDFCIDDITCKASEVLRHKTGYCYAKSHLLAALLRANVIPAGLCYQRLSIELDESYSSTSEQPFCLHGLNAVYLPEIGWYRMDARGNKDNVQAEFCPPMETLAFTVDQPGERDFDGIYTQPWDEVLSVLNSCHSYAEVDQNLPDKI